MTNPAEPPREWPPYLNPVPVDGSDPAEHEPQPTSSWQPPVEQPPVEQPSPGWSVGPAAWPTGPRPRPPADPQYQAPAQQPHQQDPVAHPSMPGWAPTPRQAAGESPSYQGNQHGNQGWGAHAGPAAPGIPPPAAASAPVAPWVPAEQTDPRLAGYYPPRPEQVAAVPSPYHAEEPVPLYGSVAPPPVPRAPVQGEDRSFQYQPGSYVVPYLKPAQWGSRGWFNRASGGKLKLKPGVDELAHRGALAMVGSTFPGPRTIGVLTPKGGSGKTPTALIVTELLASLRRESIVVGDLNPLRGTLGIRAGVQEPRHTILDLLRNTEHLSRENSAVGELAGYLRRQESGALVLASSEDTAQMQALTVQQCETVRQLLLRRYSTLVFDTGNDEAAPTWQFVSRVADVLVVPMAAKEDHLWAASQMLEGLSRRRDTAALPSRAIAVITDQDGKRLCPQDEKWLTARVKAVLYVPADPEIVSGPIRVDRLSEASRRAWTKVAAAVAEECTRPQQHDSLRHRQSVISAEPGTPTHPSSEQR